MKPTRYLTVVLIAALVGIFAASCTRSRKHAEFKANKADSLIFEAGKNEDYALMLAMTDSLEKSGDISELSANRWRGTAYYHQGQNRASEFYYKKVVNAEIHGEQEQQTYNKAARRLASILVNKGDYEGALKMALPALEKMETMESASDADFAIMLNSIGCCQLNLGMEEEAATSYARAYEYYQSYAQNGKDLRGQGEAVIGTNEIAVAYLNAKKYEAAEEWIYRTEYMLNIYSEMKGCNKVAADEFRGRVALFKAVAFQGLGKNADAAIAYREAVNTKYGKSAMGQINATDYLLSARRFNEAANNYRDLDVLLGNYGINMSLDKIRQFLLPKFRANVGAHRRDSAIAVGLRICDALDSAIIHTKISDAAELATIYDMQQKDEQIAKQKNDLTRQQLLGTGTALILIIVFFTVYTLNKRKSTHQLAHAHEKLKEAYDQLEETTALKERMESEVRIARDIQMSMVPNVFPDREGLDLYGYISPARGVGGDLYGYLLIGDSLYFCLGDVSGKGIPASLFMAQATRLFRTLASQHMMPADIATQLNAALSEDNEQGMFVTMFIGLVDLKTGHLNFCNAGHNPPVLGNEGFLDMLPNAPIGLWPGLEYDGEEVESIKGKQFFVYSDGLNEAENKQQKQFGDDHLLQILNDTPYESAEKTINVMKEAVEWHRNGAAPNDDLTMLCLMVS